MSFSELGLIPQIITALEAQGYSSPTPIQRGAIPPALNGQDVLGCAQTGTGKTCAFSVPILQRLNEKKYNPRQIRALILTPTRELALQIQECFVSYGKGLPLRSAVIYGGVGQTPQVARIRGGLDILVATPGRLLDLHNQKLLDLSHIEIFVLDEADRMLDMGFIHDVRRVLQLLPQRKQTLFFSATMPPEVMELTESLLHNPVKITVDPVSSPVDVIEQSIYFVDKQNKSKLLAELVSRPEVKNALVFSRTKHSANRIAAELEHYSISAAAIHGNKSQTARQQALADFKEGRVKVLVATDIAARGIDIEELSHVFNYNLPEVPETYIHRIGRTGRAGHEGVAIAFCDFGEKAYLRGIEALLGRSIPVVEQHPYPMECFEVEERKPRGQKSRGQKPKAVKPPLVSKPASTAAPAADTVRPEQETVQKQASKRGKRRQKLSDTLPSRPQMPKSNFIRPDPLSSDRVMDATARLLAPRPAGTAVSPQKAASKAQPQSSIRSTGHGNSKATPRPNRKPTQAGRGQRSRGGSSPAEPIRSFQKDSTEQESLMKPYYWNDN